MKSPKDYFVGLLEQWIKERFQKSSLRTVLSKRIVCDGIWREKTREKYYHWRVFSLSLVKMYYLTCNFKYSKVSGFGEKSISDGKLCVSKPFNYSRYTISNEDWKYRVMSLEYRVAEFY